uniref:Uncharacterized protein n=1 Tax=Plectus sambesii TaxID=2011161 RepID=A0A914XKE3_9BILA
VEFLASEGFLNREDDSLLLHFHVRAPTYYQECRDLKWHIQQMQEERLEQDKCINDLKEQLAVELSRHTPLHSPLPPISSSPRLVMDLPVESGPITTDFRRSSERSERSTPPLATTSVRLALSPGALVAEALEATVGIRDEAVEVTGALEAIRNVPSLERDVDDEIRSVVSVDNDVEEELAAVGGLADELNRISLTLPDRESTMDLVESLSGSPLRRFSQYSRSERVPHSASHADDAERTVNRIQAAFRTSLPESDSSDMAEYRGVHDWPMTAEDHADCPACSPRSRKQLFRRLRSRHRDVVSRAPDTTAAYLNHTSELTPGGDIDIGELEREIRAETANARGEGRTSTERQRTSDADAPDTIR